MAWWLLTDSVQLATSRLVHARTMILEPHLIARGLTLAPIVLLSGVATPFSWVRARGDRAYVSGQGALEPSGSPAGPFGRVPDRAEGTVLNSVDQVSAADPTTPPSDRSLTLSRPRHLDRTSD